MRVEHDGVYAAVASKGRCPRHPQWYHNLVAHPEITLQDGTAIHDVRAREISGDERAQWWPRCVAAFPPYAEYQASTDRTIGVPPRAALTPQRALRPVVAVCRSHHRPITGRTRDIAVAGAEVAPDRLVRERVSGEMGREPDGEDTGEFDRAGDRGEAAPVGRGAQVATR